MDGVQRLSVGEQTMRAGYVAVSKGGQGIVGNVASGERLFSEFCSCYGCQHPNDSPPSLNTKPVGSSES